MKLGCTMYSFNRPARAGQVTIESFIDYCGEIGLDGVDLLSYYWTDQAAEIERIPGWLQRNHLGLAAYAVGNNFVQADPALRSAQVQVVKDGIDVAARLGAPVLRVFGGSRPRAGSAVTSMEEALQMATDGLGVCASHAASAGVVLGVENHGGVPGTAAEVVRVLGAINSPFLRCTLDTGNFLGVGDDPVAATRQVASWVSHVHLKDVRTSAAADGATQRENVPLGDGSIALGEIFRILHDTHYDGYVSIEYEGQADPRTSVKRGAEHVRQLLQELV